MLRQVVANRKPKRPGVTIVKGNALEVLKSLGSESVDLLVTDPPFGILDGEKGRSYYEWDAMDKPELARFTEAWLTECYRALKPNRTAYVFWSQKLLHAFYHLKSDFRIERVLVWNVPNLTCRFRKTEYLWMYYPIFYLSKGTPRPLNSSFVKGENVDVFRIVMPQINFKREHKIHNQQKPLGLLKVLIRNSTNRGETVLDCFAGSGSALISAWEEGRKAVGIEMNGTHIRRSVAWMKRTGIPEPDIRVVRWDRTGAGGQLLPSPTQPEAGRVGHQKQGGTKTRNP